MSVAVDSLRYVLACAEQRVCGDKRRVCALASARERRGVDKIGGDDLGPESSQIGKLCRITRGRLDAMARGEQLPGDFTPQDAARTDDQNDRPRIRGRFADRKLERQSARCARIRASVCSEAWILLPPEHMFLVNSVTLP